MGQANTTPMEWLYARVAADFETGVLVWKDCPLMNASWRKKHAGKPAFNVPCPHGYLRGRLDRRQFKAHRVIWALYHGEWPDGEIDHINGIRDDNRIANLRLVNPVENQRNQALRSDNTSGISGVCWIAKRQKWEARVKLQGRCKHLGYFDEIEAAASARAQILRAYGFSSRHGKPLPNPEQYR